MQIRLLIGFCFVLTWSEVVRGDGENEVKRGVFPFMAFLYYSDETVVDSMGVRFQRSAVLIRPEWLLSTSIDHPVLDGIPQGFPRKTLLARAGAASIDSHFTLNEDEDEQEREVIQIVRPSIHNVEVWWFTDITLLKTLLPFKMTSAVSTISINPKREYIDKNCLILVYAKRFGNHSEEKVLMHLSVELLPASIENCGKHFTASTMTCATDSEETKTAVYDPNFCQGNSGGPLMCEGEITGLQTYVENNCKQPHLYQLLATWDSFIACGTQEKCNQDYLCNICTAFHKDEKSMTTTTEAFTIITPTSEFQEKIELPESTENVPATVDLTLNELELTTTSVSVETTTTTTPQTTVEATTPSPSPVTTTSKTTTIATEASIIYSESESTWPVGKPKESNDSILNNAQTEDSEQLGRTPKLEAQIKPRRSAADRNMCLIINLFFAMSLLACMF